MGYIISCLYYRNRAGAGGHSLKIVRRIFDALKNGASRYELIC